MTQKPTPGPPEADQRILLVEVFDKIDDLQKRAKHCHKEHVVVCMEELKKLREQYLPDPEPPPGWSADPQLGWNWLMCRDDGYCDEKPTSPEHLASIRHYGRHDLHWYAPCLPPSDKSMAEKVTNCSVYNTCQECDQLRKRQAAKVEAFWKEISKGQYPDSYSGPLIEIGRVHEKLKKHFGESDAQDKPKETSC